MTRGNPPGTVRDLRFGGLCLAALWMATGLVACDAVSDRLGRDDEATPTPSEVPTATGAIAEPRTDLTETTGGANEMAGTLTGRLVDAVTGLPVANAGVSLLGRERRAISAPDGRFRFDGLDSGATTVVVGPVPDYVARSLDVRIGADGTDLGVTPMLPASPPTLILPEYGGVVVGCDGTQVLFATDAVPGPSAVSASCLTEAREYPAPAPTGRLPLSVVDLAPESLVVQPPAKLTVALPTQPRFGDGVPLDLLRLDLDRLIWVPTGSITVEPGGVHASGDVEQLGTYMVAAPPLGADLDGATGPRVQQFHLSAEADGPPADVFPTGTGVVYAVYDYTNMVDTPITTRAFDSGGAVVFESTRTYLDRGDDSVPMLAGEAAWRPGEYNTTIYVGEPATLAYSIAWRVASAPTVVPPTPTLPTVPGSGARSGLATQVPVPPASTSCGTPSGWYAYVVQSGDTLLSLARRTDSTVAALQQGNCLKNSNIYAGTVIYLPRPPASLASPAATRPPYATVRPTNPPRATAVPSTSPSRTSPTGMPTTWYTPPPTGPVPTQPTQPLPPSAPPPTVPQAPTAAPTVVPPTSAPPPTQVVPTAVPPTVQVPTVRVPTAVPPTAQVPTNPPPPEPTSAIPQGWARRGPPNGST